MNATTTDIRTDWTTEQALELFALPFHDLLYRAQTMHRTYFDPAEVQMSTLLSVKTGGCPEDCKYCPQSAHFETEVEAGKLMDAEAVLSEAKKAKETGATRFCMGAAWRSPKDRDIPKLTAMIEGVKELGLESCMTLGMLSESQAHQLKAAGLDYYNHNLDTSEDFYDEIITTRTYQDRLDTLELVRNVGMKTCAGGIVGMGETRKDRANMLVTLATLPEHPGSVPINMLVKVEGTAMDDTPDLDILEFVRTIAVARIMMPETYVRLSAGREDMDESTQALCFFAGANSMFYGEKLLTTPNPSENEDAALLAKLGLRIVQRRFSHS